MGQILEPVEGLLPQNQQNIVGVIRWNDGWEQYGAGGVWLKINCPYGHPNEFNIAWHNDRWYWEK